MSTQRKLKAVAGRQVRHPDDGRLLDPDGELVEMNSYWRRRVNAGDVVEVKEQPKGGAK